MTGQRGSPVAEILPAEPAKLIVGALSGFPHAFEAARERLVERFGPVDIESEPIPFTFTDYYREQMGPGLLRKFFAFAELIDPASLPDVKIWTNRLEGELGPRISAAVPRPVNLDPGYITPAKLVLASAKDFSHRVYLRDGIYAEVTLHYERGGTFRSYPWTFPDYASCPDYHRFLLQARDACLRQLHSRA